MGLVALRHVGSSRTRARTHVPCIVRRILNHCTTREAHNCSFFPLIRLPSCPSQILFPEEFIALQAKTKFWKVPGS